MAHSERLAADRRSVLRSILASAGGLAAVPAQVGAPVAALASVTSPEHPDAELVSLGSRLERVHAEKRARVDDDETYGALYEDDWKLREAIDALAPASPAGFRIKARAAQIAFFYDNSAECEGPGSFVSLSHSLFRDLLSERTSL